jgi:hypothetical protein
MIGAKKWEGGLDRGGSSAVPLQPPVAIGISIIVLDGVDGEGIRLLKPPHHSNHSMGIIIKKANKIAIPLSMPARK